MAAFGVGGVLGALAARPLGRRFGTARAMLIAATIVASGLIYLPSPLRRQRDLPHRPQASAFTG